MKNISENIRKYIFLKENKIFKIVYKKSYRRSQSKCLYISSNCGLKYLTNFCRINFPLELNKPF